MPRAALTGRRALYSRDGASANWFALNGLSLSFGVERQFRTIKLTASILVREAVSRQVGLDLEHSVF